MEKPKIRQVITDIMWAWQLIPVILNSENLRQVSKVSLDQAK